MGAFKQYIEGERYPNPNTLCSDIPSVRARKMCNRLRIITIQDLASHSVKELKSTQPGSTLSNEDWGMIRRFLMGAELAFKDEYYYPLEDL
jgi:hypothetical protein